MSDAGYDRWARLQKPGKKAKEPQPLKQIGKVGQKRLDDRRAKLAAEPADARGRRQCYIGLEWTKDVVLEHVIDASVRPDLRHDKRNHRWACRDHNAAKKNGTLTPTELARVERAVQIVLVASP